MDKILGIDLGTTNSACCIWSNSKPTFIPNVFGDILTPSAVGFDDGTLVVGKVAKNRLVSHTDQTAANFKRYMGSGKKIPLAGKNYLPEELSAMVLRSLKEDAEKFLGEPVNRAVISVPAYFNDKQRKATKRAGAIAGLTVDRVINEPSAAALAYGINLGEHKTFLVLDLGGGTFDVSVIDYFDKIIEIRASCGDNFLGGEDFLLALESVYLTKCGIKQKSLSDSNRAQLLCLLENAKKELSSQTPLNLPNILKPSETVDISREEFEQITEPLVERIKKPIIQAIRDSETDIDELDSVIMVGGASRMPCIRNAVGLLLGRIPSSLLDPDTLIAAGAGVQAGLKEKNQDLDDHVLTDICPFSLGVAVHNENSVSERDLLFSPIIERNCVVPISRVERYYTVSDQQTKIDLGIYQGESRMVRNNIKIGNLDISIPPNDKGEESVDVRFSYDMNGILDVDLMVISTGTTLSHTIINSANDLSDEEIENAREKLAALKFHPRDSQQNQLLIARAEKLYEATLGETRELLNSNLQQFEKLLQSQDLQRIEELRPDFERLIDDLESLLLL